MTRRLLKSCCSRVIAVLFATCGFVPGTWAQVPIEDVHVTPRFEQPQAQNHQSAGDPALNTHTKAIKVDVNLVLVTVSIVDPMNRQVTGLDKSNFDIFEGKERQAILHFSSEDAPISLGAVFDMSGSMADKIERAREAVVEFFKTANPQDEFFMIAFADKPEELTGFTQSVEEIEGKLLYTVPKGRTALLDAIYLGLNQMRKAKYEKKALLIISDGGDNHSRYTEAEIKNLVKESDVEIYAIGIYDHYFPTEEERLGPQLLTDITGLPAGAHSRSRIQTIWPMWPRRSESSCATNTSSDTGQPIPRMMVSGTRFV